MNIKFKRSSICNQLPPQPDFAPTAPRRCRVPSFQSNLTHPAAALISSILLIAEPTDATAAASPSLRERLQDYSVYQSLFGNPNSPTQRLLARVQSVQEVLQRAELLTRLGQYDAARALLRGREVGLLSYDLGFAVEAYRLLPQQAGRQALAALEASRAALAAEGATEEEVLGRLQACEAALRTISDVLEAAAD